MKSTFKVLFYLKKNAVAKNGEAMIMSRITIDGKMCQFSTKQKIKPKDWSVKMGKAIGRATVANKINQLLENLKVSLYNTYHEILRRENSVTAEKVRNEFLGHNEQCVTLLDLFSKQVSDVKSLVGISKSYNTYQKTKLVGERIHEFIQYKYHISDININEVTPMFINDFDIYMRTVCKCCTNSATKYMRFLKQIIIIAQNNGFITSNPFVNYKFHLQKVDRGYLTEEELAIISQKEFASERLEQVRDIFIFACFTGLAYIDVKNLSKEHVRTSFDGNLWIMTKRQKTNTTVNVPVLTIPKMILEKYKDRIINDKLLPVISNQKLNSYLKEIADVCGINKNLTFHLARHTFATTTTLAKGVPIETVSKMLGHTNIKTTQIYARITNNKISNDMKDLSDKFVGIENIYKEVAIKEIKNKI